MVRVLVMLTLLVSCSTGKKPLKDVSVDAPKSVAKEFAQGEIILATQYLTKIFDQEMAPGTCVPDKDEAELLLRTIRPRMEMVSDDIEASLDNTQEVEKLIKDCDKNCTCGYLDELLREHLVPLNKTQKKMMNAKKSEKEMSRCMNYVQSTFCQSELYQTLNQEKVDFTFEE